MATHLYFIIFNLNELKNWFVSDEITIICLGPLTNIATAIILEPNLQDYVKNIFIMGGSVAGIGNFAPNVEYNFGKDPESNFISLNSTTKTPVILIPWDVCLSYKISLVGIVHSMNLNYNVIS